MVHLDPGKNRSLYHSRVYVSPTCNATAGICRNWWALEKNHVSGLKHGKTRMQSVGSRLCQFSIVVHCIPGVYVIPIVGLSGSHSKRYIPSKKKQKLRHAVLTRWIISWPRNSNRSLYQFKVYVSPTCNATAGICRNWWVLGKKHVSGVKHGKTRMQSVGSMLCQLSIVVHCCPLYPQGLCDPHCWVCRHPTFYYKKT